MNEIFSNDVTSSESNWKNTPQSLKDWKKHPRPSSKLFVSSKNHISKSANVSITISSYIMYIIFRVLRSTSPNFEPSIWDSFSSAVPTVPTFLLHYHDPCLGIKRHIQFFSRPSLGSWQPSQCGDTEDHNKIETKRSTFWIAKMGVRIFQHAATGAPERLSDCACAWYTLRGSLERTWSGIHVWRYDVWRLQVSETLKMCGSRYINMDDVFLACRGPEPVNIWSERNMETYIWSVTKNCCQLYPTSIHKHQPYCTCFLKDLSNSWGAS